MTKPPRICPCNEKVAHGVLCTCQRKAKQQRDQRHVRPTAHKRGYNHAWRKASKEYLALYPHCVMCAASGINNLASVVDHIIPHKGDDVLFWSRSNWQSLCHPHHNSTKQRLEKSK